MNPHHLVNRINNYDAHPLFLFNITLSLQKNTSTLRIQKTVQCTKNGVSAASGTSHTVVNNFRDEANKDMENPILVNAEGGIMVGEDMTQSEQSS